MYVHICVYIISIYIYHISPNPVVQFFLVFSILFDGHNWGKNSPFSQTHVGLVCFSPRLRFFHAAGSTVQFADPVPDPGENLKILVKLVKRSVNWI